jgi:hypothetical protein
MKTPRSRRQRLRTEPRKRPPYRPYIADGVKWSAVVAALDSWVAAHDSDHGAVSHVAAQFGIVRRTLAHHWSALKARRASDADRGEQGDCSADLDAETRGGHNRALTGDEEQAVYDRLWHKVCVNHRPLVDADIARFAAETMANRPLSSRPLGPPWQPSKGWIFDYKRRHEITNKRPREWRVPTAGTAAVRVATTNFLLECLYWLALVGPSLFLNMDETSWRLINAQLLCLGFRGEQCRIDTGGDRRSAFTTVLAVAGDGTKLRPSVLKRGTTDACLKTIRAAYGERGYWHYNANGWATGESTIAFIHRCILPHTRRRQCALVLDSYKAHMTDEVKRVCAHENIHLIFVPPGLTPDRQMLDRTCFAPLKDHGRLLWREHRAAADAGAIDPIVGIGDMLAAWDALAPATIQAGFLGALELDALPLVAAGVPPIRLHSVKRRGFKTRYWLPWQAPPPLVGEHPPAGPDSPPPPPPQRQAPRTQLRPPRRVPRRRARRHASVLVLNRKRARSPFNC